MRTLPGTNRGTNYGDFSSRTRRYDFNWITKFDSKRRRDPYTNHLDGYFGRIGLLAGQQLNRVKEGRND